VLTAVELTDRVRLTHTTLNNSMESGVDIELAKRQCTAADMQASRFFASHAWTGTHEGQDFGKTSFGILNSARTARTALTASC